jgi:endonuclease YncB( thermonuclease family)
MLGLSDGEAIVGLIGAIVVLSIALVGVREARERQEEDREASPQPKTPSPATDAPKVIQSLSEWRAVDGDGLAGPGRQRVRLLDFDAPETWRREGVSAREKAMGLAAKARLSQLLHSGMARLVLTGRKCKYGRDLGRLEVGGRDVAEIMIKEGHARPYDGGKRLPW